MEKHKLTFSEFLNLNGWGRHVYIWAGSGEYQKTINDWFYYEKHRMKMSLPKDAPRSVFTTIDFECSPQLRREIRKKTRTDLKYVREQLKHLGEI